MCRYGEVSVNSRAIYAVNNGVMDGPATGSCPWLELPQPMRCQHNGVGIIQ